MVDDVAESPQNRTRFLVVNADDFGYCDQRNRGIVESFLNGVVSSASLLPNADKALEAVQLSEEYGIPLGLHLNLTEGRPIKTLKNSLTSEKGLLRGKFKFRDALKHGEIDLDEIKDEVQAQLQWFVNTVGSLPTHINGHQHVHVIPQVCEILATVMKENGVHWTRIPVEQNLDECVWVEESRKHFYKSVITEAEDARVVFSSHGIRFPNTFIGLSTLGKDMTLPRLTKAIEYAFILQELPDIVKEDFKTVCELMVHPGYKSIMGCGGCGEGPDLFACSSDREHELITLESSDLKEFLKSSNISVCSFKELP